MDCFCGCIKKPSIKPKSGSKRIKLVNEPDDDNPNHKPGSPRELKTISKNDIHGSDILFTGTCSSNDFSQG